MLTWIEWFARWLYDWGGNLVRSALAELARYVQWFFGLARSMGDWVFGTVIDSLANQFPSVDFSAYRTLLAQANYLFPVSECVSFLLLVLTLWLCVFLYRVVKSWIPTVAS